jgi:hypothetical protein
VLGGNHGALCLSTWLQPSQLQVSHLVAESQAGRCSSFMGIDVGCALAVHWLCIGCALAVHWLCIGCALAVHWLCLGCALAGHASMVVVDVVMRQLHHSAYIGSLSILASPAKTQVLFSTASSCKCLGLCKNEYTLSTVLMGHVKSFCASGTHSSSHAGHQTSNLPAANHQLQ